MRALKYIENLFNILKKCDQNGGVTVMKLATLDADDKELVNIVK
jgi:hypothetical protein